MEDKHKERHVHLHRRLDELVADFIQYTQKLPSKTTVKELIDWSYEQSLAPDHPNHGA
ncbi:hypothetical protein [Pseudodesulfovibrio karagichevae]|uniref:Uncharacterized protein n=1 Tax=Pseudodesulfovibrio karagichevae TaxID=3239305 RepID=A0ABV4JXS4_9BACT